jgi:hypothetical protein
VCHGCMVQLHKYQYEICPYCRTPVGTNEEEFRKLQSRANGDDASLLGSSDCVMKREVRVGVMYKQGQGVAKNTN